MNTPRINPLVSAASDGLSRRTVVGAGTVGLALALLTRGVSSAAAQESTPEATGGMPEGVTAIPLTNAPIPAADVPAGGFTLSVYRLTVEPGAVAPVATFPYPSVVFVESGTLTCPGDAPRYVIAADGSVREVGDETVTVNAGEAIYVPTNVPDGASNEGSELLTLLAIDLLPMEEMATPSA